MNVAIVYRHYQELHERYSELQLVENPTEPIRVEGLLHFMGDFCGQLIEDKYSIKILLPEDYPFSYPSVRETGNRIPKDFHHYVNNNLCLGAPYAIKKKFRETPTLLGFVEKILIPYLYSFSYKEKFGRMPFGELPHGWSGILEYYQDLFCVDNNKAVVGLLNILAIGNYRSHSRCPCGSRKRVRDCHGRFLGNMLRIQPESVFKNEYDHLVDYLLEVQKSPKWKS